MKGLSHADCCLSCPYTCMKEFFTNEDMQLINDNRSEMNFTAGQAILRQGSFVSQIVYLKTGIIKKVLEGKNERNTIVKLVDNNHFLALPVLGNPDRYPFSIFAISDCSVCFIKKDTMYEIITRNEKAHAFIIDWYANDYLYLYNKMSVISTRNSHGKLASTLLYLTSEKFSSDVLNLISRREIAELSSLSKESVNKILIQLKHDGLIEIKKDKIRIKRRDLLERLSTVG